jgi:aqualysin 1
MDRVFPAARARRCAVDRLVRAGAMSIIAALSWACSSGGGEDMVRAQGSSSPTRIEIAAPSAYGLPTEPASISAAAGDAGAAAGATQDARTDTPTPADVAPGKRRLIVSLRPEANSPQDEARKAVASVAEKGLGSGRVDHVYSHALKGYAISLPEAAVEAFLAALRRNPLVASVEADGIARIEQSSTPPWNLDRIDQRDRPLDRVFNPGRTGASGAGVRAYVVDSGILASHQQLTGRVLPGFSSIDDGRGDSDCNGHGTHVAATIGSPAWGVAAGVSLVPVRVLECDGTGPWSGILAGLDWIAANAQKPAVVNLSLGGNVSSTVDAAVARITASGIPVVVAAGNRAIDACLQSPGREPSVITVGASTSSDAVTASSNWGPCVDLFAPGSGITSAWHTSETATRTLGGTSMAAPHASGAIALMLERQPDASPAAIEASLKLTATAGRLNLAANGSPNLLLYLDEARLVAESVTTASTGASVGSLSGVGIPASGGWVARVIIGVKDPSGAAVSGINVRGVFSDGDSPAVCTTDAGGRCSVFSGPISTRIRSTFFTIVDLTR